MQQLKVVTWPSKILQTRAREVTSFDQSIQDLARAMHALMDQEGGIGLAANQVNILSRVLTIYIQHSKERFGDAEDDRRWWHNKRFTIINPVILKIGGPKFRTMEGCLSFPEIYDFVERPSEITVRAWDEFGKEHTIEADGLFAVCLQHEIDHLDGIVFTERMSRLKANAISKKMMRSKKENVF